MLEKTGYFFLIAAFIATVYLIIIDMIVIFPWGTIYLIALAGIGFLFIRVVGDKMKNKEDSYYEKNVEK
ncbi:hypothetical protein ACFL6G_01650 [candidate division KSB1 bacterium]